VMGYGISDDEVFGRVFENLLNARAGDRGRRFEVLVDIRGMHGPIAGIHEVPRMFRPQDEGGILNLRGVVDYARPLKKQDGSIDFDMSVTPGVFLVVRTEHEQIQEAVVLARQN
jgi:predicted homoserine dehydrogenase-like protein